MEPPEASRRPIGNASRRVNSSILWALFCSGSQVNDNFVELAAFHQPRTALGSVEVGAYLVNDGSCRVRSQRCILVATSTDCQPCRCAVPAHRNPIALLCCVAGGFTPPLPMAHTFHQRWARDNAPDYAHGDKHDYDQRPRQDLPSQTQSCGVSSVGFLALALGLNYTSCARSGCAAAVDPCLRMLGTVLAKDMSLAARTPMHSFHPSSIPRRYAGVWTSLHAGPTFGALSLVFVQ